MKISGLYMFKFIRWIVGKSERRKIRYKRIRMVMSVILELFVRLDNEDSAEPF